MKPRKAEIKVRNAYEKSPLRIVADAVIAIRGLGGGRLIPLVILDTSDRPDVEEYIRVHQAATKPGDVKVQWGQVQGHDDTVALFLSVIRPVEVFMVLQFNIVKQGVLVDQMLVGKGVYIQAGREGDRFAKDPNRPKVLLEVGDLGFGQLWNKIFRKHLEKYFREHGLSRSQSRRASESAIEQMRELGSFRMGDMPQKA